MRGNFVAKKAAIKAGAKALKDKRLSGNWKLNRGDEGLAAAAIMAAWPIIEAAVIAEYQNTYMDGEDS